MNDRAMNVLDRAMYVEPDDVDFQGYLAEQEAGKVWPASHWLDVEDDTEVKTFRYPWNVGKFAMRMGELTLWTGYSKHGKSSALNQAMLCAIEQGARVGILSLEFSIAMLVKIIRWQSFGFKSGGMTQTQRDSWREWVDERLWFYDHHGMQEGARIAAAVWHMVTKLGIEIVVVDSLMMCGVKTDGDGYATAQTEFVNRLLNIVREHPCHIHLVAHARKERDDGKAPGLLDVSGHANLVNLPHNIVSFWKNKKEDRKEDAMFIVLGDRATGCDAAVRLWFHDTARQFVSDRYVDPAAYCR